MSVETKNTIKAKTQQTKSKTKTKPVSKTSEKETHIPQKNTTTKKRKLKPAPNPTSFFYDDGEIKIECQYEHFKGTGETKYGASLYVEENGAHAKSHKEIRQLIHETAMKRFKTKPVSVVIQVEPEEIKKVACLLKKSKEEKTKQQHKGSRNYQFRSVVKEALKRRMLPPADEAKYDPNDSTGT